MKPTSIIQPLLASAATMIAALAANAGPTNPAINFTLTHGEPVAAPSYDWVEFGNGQFLAWSNADAMMSTSTDGIMWTHIPTEKGVSVRNPVWGGGDWVTQWVTSASEHEWRYLVEGEWKPIADIQVLDIEYGNGYWLAMATDGRIWRSTDLITWEQVAHVSMLMAEAEALYPRITRPPPSDAEYKRLLPALSFAGGRFAFASVSFSEDGTTWTPSKEFPAGPPRLNFHPQIDAEFFGEIGGPYVSSEAITVEEEWRHINRRGSLSSVSVIDYAFTTGMAASLTTSGVLYISDEDTLEAFPTRLRAHRVAAGNGEVRAINSQGYIHTYRDGAITSELVAVPSELTDIAFGNGRWVIVGNNGLIMTSNSDQSWTILNTLRHVGFYNGTFLALGENQALISSDGFSWQPVPMPPIDRVGGFEVLNGFIAFEHNSTRSALSKDGINWVLYDILRPTLITHIYGKSAALRIDSNSVYHINYGGERNLLENLLHPMDVSSGNGTAIITGAYYYSSFMSGAFTVGTALIGFNQPGNAYINPLLPSPYSYGNHYHRESYLISAAYGAGRHLVVGEGAATFWTEDFADYSPAQFLDIEEAESIGRPMLYDVAFGQGRFVAVGAGNAIYTSNLTETDDPLWGHLWDAGDGWYQEADLGWIYPMEDNWAWHLSLGWLLATPDAGLFPFIDGVGWAWTSPELLPWVYTYNDGNWWTVDLYSQVPNLVFWGYDEEIQGWAYQLQQDF